MIAKFRRTEKSSGQIGIFLGRQTFNRLVSKQYDRGLTELVQAASRLGISPVWFSIPQEELDDGILRAATKTGGKWTIGFHPLPKVVYDRALFARKDRASGKKIRAALAEQGVTFVNSCSAFSKWHTHISLSEDTILLPHLPKTVRFRQVSDLSDMLAAYSKVYLKSFWGSRGKEVLLIERDHQRLTLIYPNGKLKTFGSLGELVGAVYRFMGTKKCVIQQPIDLASYQKRRFDVRVLLQKISLNRWDCTALCLRLALPGRGITSTSQGGEVKQLSPVLAELWPAHYLEIIAQIKALAYKVANRLEDKYGALGELGIDLGIDINGGVWLFEVNGKPGKTTVRRLMQDDLIQLAYQRPLLYSQMLLEEK